MGRITTGWFRSKKRKKPKYLTTMICLDCGHMWEASRISNPCPGCASRQVTAMSRWAPAKYGMPILNKKKAS